MTPEATTPLMRQYQAAKTQVPHALLLFRLGDFYELFYDDAVTAARELEITLTARNKERGDAVPMCGVPYHAAEGYISRLIQRGFRVAICEKMEEAGPGKKLVRREITRVITPGTATGSDLLRSHENNYLAAVFTRNGRSGFAYADLSTGEFRATELESAELVPTLESLNVREVVHAEGEPPSARCLETPVEPWFFAGDYAGRLILENFRLLSLDGCGLGNHSLATSAAGALLQYLRDTQKSALGHLNPPTFYQRQDSMVIDAASIRNLELVEPLFAGESREGTLIAVLDRTETGMGGRLLRQRILTPSCDRAEIENRLDTLGELASKTIVRADLRKLLGGVQDLERLLAKITLGSANPRDVFALGRSLAQLPGVRALVDGLESAAFGHQMELVTEVRER